MVLVNYGTRELTAKIVYYGPGLCGKTTNLEYIHRNLPQKTRGKMLSLATKTDRTLFFDFLPIELGSIRGMKTKIQLYTVPGQVFYDATRKLVLKGADGVVFVADSQNEMMESNLQSWESFKQNLLEHGLDVHTIPIVMQYNKRDLPNVLPVEELNQKLNEFKAPFYEAVAVSGQGVQDTLKGITRLVMESLSKRYKTKKQAEEMAKAQEAKMESLPSVEQVVKQAISEQFVPVVDAQNAPLALDPSALEVSAEEYEELEEINELTHEPEPLPDSVAKTQQVDVVIQETAESQPEMLDSSQEIFADASDTEDKVIRFESAIGRTKDISIPVEVRVGPPGEEVRLQIAIELKIKILPK